MDWFLYDRDLRHERVNGNINIGNSFEQGSSPIPTYLFDEDPNSKRKKRLD